MSAPPPTADVQIAFLQNVQRLLAEGLFTATYKYALLLSLADLAVLKGMDSGDALELSTREIAESMIRLYWRQAAPFPGAHHRILQQSTHRQAEIVSFITATRTDTAASLTQLQAHTLTWNRLVRRVERVVQEQPLWKLQTVGKQPLDFLYPKPQGVSTTTRASTITLRPGVAYCLRAFHGLVSDLVRGAWIQHLRRMNGDVLGEAVDLTGFLFGTERSALGVYQPFLAEIQRGRCFYCLNPLKASGEVDHFIPWSRYPIDLGHNFVLAHSDCNQKKSSHLADVHHLERWVERNVTRGADLSRWLTEVKVESDASASERVARWAYSQTDRAHGQVWVRGSTLVPLDSSWRSLLPMIAT